MSNQPSKELSGSTPKQLSSTETNKLLDLVLKDHNLGLTSEELDRLNKLAKSHAILQPERLRICDKTCPAHDICPYITQVEEKNWPHGLRCPMEAEIYKQTFEELYSYIISMSEEDTVIPEVELGYCKDIAFYKIIEHRLSAELAKSPGATVDSVVAGAMGETKKEENPAIVAWTRAVDKLKSYQDRLIKLVENRLKRISTKNSKRVKFAETLAEIIKNKPNIMLNNSVKAIIDSLPEQIAKNNDAQLNQMEGQVKAPDGRGPGS